VKAGQSLLQVSGPAQAILHGERVALNFVQRLSGIATLTRQFVDAVRGTRAQVLDTRKTTPGLRRLEKYAVTCGGGHNHRFGLFDHVLIRTITSPRCATNRRTPSRRVDVAREKFPQHKSKSRRTRWQVGDSSRNAAR